MSFVTQKFLTGDVKNDVKPDESGLDNKSPATGLSFCKNPLVNNVAKYKSKAILILYIWDEAQELSVLTRNPMIRMQDSLRPHLKNTTADFPFSVSLLYDSNEETSQGNTQKCR